MFSLFLGFAAHGQAEGLKRFPSPDKGAEAFVNEVPFRDSKEEWTEAVMMFRDYAAKEVAMQDFTSGDGDHGLVFVSGKWTPDSQQFIFTMNSSGGHSSWHFRLFAYDRKANTVVGLANALRPVVSPEIVIDDEGVVKLRVQEGSADGSKLVAVRVPEILQKEREVMRAVGPVSEMLRSLVGESDVVAVVKVDEEPIGTSGSSPLPSDKPTVYWRNAEFRVRVIDVLKGKIEGDEMPISLRVPTYNEGGVALGGQIEEMMEPYRKGRKLVVFLQDHRLHDLGAKTGDINLVGFDPWYSVQPYSRGLELEVRNFVKEMKR